MKCKKYLFEYSRLKKDLKNNKRTAKARKKTMQI